LRRILHPDCLLIRSTVALSPPKRQAIAMDRPADLTSALATLLDTMAVARHDWWVVSGTAAWLHDCADPPERDVDVLVDLRDVNRLSRHAGLAFAPGRPASHFRSQAFATRPGSIATEFFAGFEIRQGDRWLAYQPVDRCWRSYAGLRLPVPGATELIRLFSLMGRAKDLTRAARLSASVRFPSSEDNA
jgi:hypothetical protein